MVAVTDNASAPRVALVHDFLLDVRGAERVFSHICGIWPDADIFTPVYDEAGTRGWFAHRRIHTSFLQRLRPTARSFRSLLPLYPTAMRSFDFSGYDLVVSSSSAWAHTARHADGATHVCYCHNPFRYVWNERDATLTARSPLFTRPALRALFSWWRRWDRDAARRVDRYVTNSETTASRIREYLGRESSVVYPPVDVSRFTPGPVEDHYLVLSALMPHKRIELAIRAFNILGLPLVIIGGGPDRRRLEGLAGPTIRFAGQVEDEEAARLLQGCRALITTAVEEFGIAALEAQAAGRPVIAMRAGGALETVIEGVTGCFWEGGPDELAAAVATFDEGAVDPRACVDQARRFDASVFRDAFRREVELAMALGPSPFPARIHGVRGPAAPARVS